MSMRAKERESKLLVSSNRSEKAAGQSKTEIQLRIIDKINMGHLVTKQVDGLIRLWCRFCLKVVNPNKSNCQSHMDSGLHKRNTLKDGQSVAEEIVLSASLKKWRLGNPDHEGRTLSENTDFFRMETVRMLMLSGVEITKVRDYLNYQIYTYPLQRFHAAQIAIRRMICVHFLRSARDFLLLIHLICGHMYLQSISSR